MKALTKVGPFKTISIISSLMAIMLVCQWKVVFIFDDKRARVLHGIIAFVDVVGVMDPLLL